MQINQLKEMGLSRIVLLQISLLLIVTFSNCKKKKEVVYDSKETIIALANDGIQEKLDKMKELLSFNELRFCVIKDTGYFEIQDINSINLELIDLKFQLLVNSFYSNFKEHRLNVNVKYKGYGTTWASYIYSTHDLSLIQLKYKDEKYKSLALWLVKRFTLDETYILDATIQQLYNNGYTSINSTFVESVLVYGMNCDKEEYLELYSYLEEIFTKATEFNFQEDLKYLLNYCKNLV